MTIVAVFDEGLGTIIEDSAGKFIWTKDDKIVPLD